MRRRSKSPTLKSRAADLLLLLLLQYTSNPANLDSKNTLHSPNKVKFPFFSSSLKLLKYFASNELISDPSLPSTSYKYWQIYYRMLFYLETM